MPYYLNCTRCNKDNKFRNLGSPCKKCSGTGRDWREDHELEGFHKWAGFGIDELKEKGVIEFVDEYDELKVFTYMDSIPTCSISAEIEEIRKSLGNKLEAASYPSQIFCKHEWVRKGGESIEVCSKCEKEREIVDIVKQEKVVLQYNKDLHDQRYYFPNRCYACDHYSDSRGEPESGSDMIFCNIGGKVQADTGCPEFNADITAGCQDCWNYSKNFDEIIEKHFCDINGKLTTVLSGYCSEYVHKERTNKPIPPANNCLEISRNLIGNKTYPRDPSVRKVILDAMNEAGLFPETIQGHNCKNCSYQVRDKVYEWGACSYHDITLLCQDDRNCKYFKPSNESDISRYHKILITASLYGDNNKNHYPINEHISLCAESGHKFSLVKNNDNHEYIIQLEDYLLRSIYFSEENNSIIAEYVGSSIFFDKKTGARISNQNSTDESDNTIEWLNAVSEGELFNKIEEVSKTQRFHDVFSGDRMSNCERCSKVIRDHSYPNGSPTGLKCSRLNIFVTANGVCDEYFRH
ncbi:MAG: hypothetical protein ISR69_06075 [Gammaproteobacteria bacterium]|nr:hypothetical protein [Gammaproteobacteria bacterium]